MKWWPAVLFFAGIFFFFANYAPKEQTTFEMVEEGCLVHSIHYKNSVLAKEMLDDKLWARVLAIYFYGNLGHAVTVFVYENHTYVYDPNHGSFPVAAYPLYDPLAIAEICFPKAVIKRAHYLEPTMLLHYQNDSFRINK